MKHERLLAILQAITSGLSKPGIVPCQGEQVIKNMGATTLCSRLIALSTLDNLEEHHEYTMRCTSYINQRKAWTAELLSIQSELE